MLSIEDYRLLKQSLEASAYGPFFPDWEFQTLFGLPRPDVAIIAADFNDSTPLNEDIQLAIHNAMLNLLGYPHDMDDAWSEWLSVSRDELQALFERWRIYRENLEQD